MSKYSQFMDNLVDKVISTINDATRTGSWEPPWYTSDLAKNFDTGKEYKGSNQIRLYYSNNKRNDLWATYKQWKKHKKQVRKGEKGTHIIKVVNVPVRDNEEEHQTVIKTYTVFSADQLYEPPPEVTRRSHTRNEIDDFVESLDMSITHGGSSAYYVARTDTITIPEPGNFKSADGYYATLFHEIIHSTATRGRSPRPWDEDGKMTGDKSDPQYAKEELVAEFGSAILCHRFGVTPSIPDGHLMYLASWAKQIKAKPQILRQAMACAQDAADKIYQIKTEQPVEV